jgi:hypothetical protein
MGISHKPTTRVVSCRVDNDTYTRLDLRARKKGVKLGAYIKAFLERDLYRNTNGKNSENDKNE